MQKITLDKNILIGGVVHDAKDYQIVHMNLKAGNQTDNYSNDKTVSIFNISGVITVTTEEKVFKLEAFEILEIECGVEHIITCLEDAQVIVYKI